MISELTNLIFPWKGSAKQLIASSLSGNMGNLVEGTVTNARACYQIPSLDLNYSWCVSPLC